MLIREIVVVYSEIHTKHINAICEQNVEFLQFVITKFLTHI